MSLPHQRFQKSAGTLMALAAFCLSSQADAATVAQVTNPIARIARLFNAQLVKVEDRVTWLDNQVSSYSKRCEYPLKTGLGYRGARAGNGSADPSITLDLGRELPIDQIFLVPSHREFLQDSGIFPKRFTLEISKRADFAQSTVIYKSGQIPHPPTDGSPVLFTCHHGARYVRLTVQEGHMKEAQDLFGLSEFVVISQGEPASFEATVETVGSLNVAGLWYPEALVDGRTPLGIWHNASKPNSNPGDAVMVENPEQTTTWKIRLDEAAPIDRLALFPYQVNRSFDTSVFPESLVIRQTQEDGGEEETVFEWSNPLPGSSHMTPLVIPMKGKTAKTLLITATRPWIMGDRKEANFFPLKR